MTVALTHEFLFATVIDSPEPKSESVLLHCVSGLSRLGLIQNLIEGLPLDFNNFAAKKGWTLPEGTMFIVRPTTFGGEYFLWGTGNGDIDPWTYADLPKDLPGTNMLSLRGKPEVLSATTASSDKLQRRN